MGTSEVEDRAVDSFLSLFFLLSRFRYHSFVRGFCIIASPLSFLGQERGKAVLFVFVLAWKTG